MADFYQTGAIATLHRLSPGGLARLEADLERFSKTRPIGLVLPALYSEFETPAMHNMVESLRGARYLRHIVVALARADRAALRRAASFFRRFEQPVTVLWIDSPRIQGLLRLLERHGLGAGEDGKGRSCWLAQGYLLGTEACDIIAVHDCDIANYDRMLLARLLYPVANPNLGFEFSKGYYARVTDRMHGRATRLFMTPLIRALEGRAPRSGLLRFLDSFRYPLSGECAMVSNLARVNRLPGDWGLEVGVLAEVYRNCAASRICQVDLSDNYEHKHQSLSADDPSQGLRRMTYDIARSLFRTLAGEGVPFSRAHFRSLELRYVRMAEDAINRYQADAMLNGLDFDRHEEETAVAVFAKSLRSAAHDFAGNAPGTPLIPSWNRVISAVPEFFNLLLGAVEADAEIPHVLTA